MSSNGNSPPQKQKQEVRESSPCPIPESSKDGLKRKRVESGSGSLPFSLSNASPQRLISLDELMAAAKGLDNMALAHEIAVNRNFTIDCVKPEENSLIKNITSIVHRAFWDVLSEELEQDPPLFEHALKLIAEIKEKLVSLLLPHHAKLKSEIDESLDLELMKQQMEYSTFNVKSCADFIISVMARLCAPVRDDKIKELKELNESVPLFKGIFEVLDLMKLDMANFTIDAMRPVIEKHSAEYEREQFGKYLSANPNGLASTELWLRLALDEEISDMEAFAEKLTCSSPNAKIASSFSTSVPECSDVKVAPIDSPSAIQVLIRAYWDLLLEPSSSTFPETLIVDRERISSLHQKFMQLWITASCIMTFMGNIGVDIQNFDSSLKEKLKDRILVLLEANEEKLIVKQLPPVAEELIQQSTSLLPNLDAKRKDDLRSSLLSLEDPKHPVRKLCCQRIKQFVIPILINPNSSPVKIPLGMNVVQKELAQLAGSFLKITSYNRTVFADIYDEIIKRHLGSRENQSNIVN